MEASQQHLAMKQQLATGKEFFEETINSKHLSQAISLIACDQRKVSLLFLYHSNTSKGMRQHLSL